MNKRGRPKKIEEITPIHQYSIIYKEDNGDKQIWKFDTRVFPNGPISVELFTNEYHVPEQLIKDIAKIKEKYIQIKGERKPRITKADNLLLETLEKQLENEYYKLYPEDAPKKKIHKNKK